jgi:hypothetical protein
VGSKVWQGATTVGQATWDVAKRGEYYIGAPPDWDFRARNNDESFTPVLSARWRF